MAIISRNKARFVKKKKKSEEKQSVNKELRMDFICQDTVLKQH